jgi:hypothetical protein
MFNGIYGEESDEIIGWGSTGGRSPLNIDGTDEDGAYVYINLLVTAESARIKSFQLWKPGSHYARPINFYVLGSDDETSWTKLYDSLNTDKFYSEVEQRDRKHTDIIPLDDNTQYKYICLFLMPASNISSAGCQEFRLFTV